MNKIPLIVICGPTASGKTKLSVDLAKIFNCEIISADSMQIYKHMDVGTAKPTKQEMENISHYMVDFLHPKSAFSVADYVREARKYIQDIALKNKIPMLVGGTGLYINSIIDNINFEEQIYDKKIREKLQEQSIKYGNEYMWQKLKNCDEQSAEKLHHNNIGRIIRALEVFEITGDKMSDVQRKSRQNNNPYELCMIGLNYEDRNLLYEKINKRVDIMLENSLVQEAKMLYDMNISKNALQAIGYKELFDYFDNKISLDNAIEIIKRNSRKYAKRQLTWFRREKRIHWIFWEREKTYENVINSSKKIIDKIYGY